MVKIHIETLGTERLIRSLTRVGKMITDYRDPFETIASHFWTIEERNFAGQGVPKKFKALSPKYKKWKNKNYPGKKIMQLTGRLYNSLTAQNQTDAQDTIKNITRKYAELGTRVPYAHRHHVGYKMPKRKVIQIEEKDKRVWTRIIQRWAFGLFEKQGFEVYKETFGGVV